MIVATAGHIDHGKTQLVRALTGTDTDRLPEEKARGISIDLGFAYWPLPEGGVLGFVDVPGHERFVRNMLAGVCGIDFALLVIAADDGIMPQTIEHLQILDLLGVRRGIAVLTKIDRVAAERVHDVHAQVRSMLAGTSLAQAQVVPVCALTGQGIDSLRRALCAANREHVERFRPGQHFRLSIDRAFSIVGAGTVVTGTVFAGEAGTGDRLLVSPSGMPVRVRSIQVHGIEQPRVRAGERCAMSLAGVAVQDLERGAWVQHEAIHAPTQRIETQFTLLAGETHPLEHWTPVHLHLATMECMARVATIRGKPIAPGSTASVQLVLDRPVAALHADRFILRDQSARRTLGGGFVLDPFAVATRRTSSARLAAVVALGKPTPEEALAALLAIPDQAVDVERFEKTFNLTAERASSIYRVAAAHVLGREPRVAVAGERAARIRAEIVARLHEFHRQQPRSTGIECEALRKQVVPWLATDAFLALLRGMADARDVDVNAGLATLPGFDATANAEDERIWQAVMPALLEGGFAPPTVVELSAALRIPQPTIKDFLHRKTRTGEVLRAGEQRFYPRASMAALAATATALARSLPSGAFTVAQYRDATQTTRALAIPVLELLDSLGITQRNGDLRRIARDFVPILGAPAPSRARVRPARSGPSTRAR